MLTLIAESKTMLPSEKPVSVKDFAEHTPVYDDIAGAIMDSLGGLSLEDLAAETKLSSSLAAKMQRYIYEFDNKSTGNPAIEAYTGVVFKALDFSSLSEDAKLRCCRETAIISSLYGWLRPYDIVKTYRLDFTSRLEEEPVNGLTMNAFWRKDVTKALVRKIQEDNITEILHILPSDAAACIDWKLVKRFAKVWKVDFREMKDEGKFKTPIASKLKTMRGKLLRQILEEGIENVKDLMKIESVDYFCEGTPVYSDHISFLC